MNFKKLLLSTSILISLINPSLATKKLAEDLADRETNEEAIIAKLRGSGDFTLNLNVDKEVETITEMVSLHKKKNSGAGEKPTSQELAEISFNAKRRMLDNLDRFKEHPVVLGNGYSTTRNFKDKLSTISARNPLVYAVNPSDRSEPDSFLPVTYRSNFVSKDLCAQLWYYAQYCNGRITPEESKQLNRYLQPLFYIVQKEIIKILEGDENIFNCQRWVYGKDRNGIIASVKAQTAHHHTLIQNANKTAYYDTRDIEDRIVPQLVDMALNLIPSQWREVYNDGRHSFRVHKNAKGAISLIRSDVDNFPYPILQNERLNELNIVNDMNIPFGYVGSPSLNNQWARVKQFVMDDPRIAVEEKKNVQKLLEPVGHLFHNALGNLRVLRAHYPERDPAIDELRDFQRQYVTTHTIPEDALNAFYHNNVALTPFLAGLRVKSATHEAMTSDLLPVGLRGNIVNIRNNLLEGLVFHDMVDRFKIFYPDVVLF